MNFFLGDSDGLVGSLKATVNFATSSSFVFLFQFHFSLPRSMAAPVEQGAQSDSLPAGDFPPKKLARQLDFTLYGPVSTTVAASEQPLRRPTQPQQALTPAKQHLPSSPVTTKTSETSTGAAAPPSVPVLPLPRTSVLLSV